MCLLHFHSNVIVPVANNGFVAVTQQCKRKYYYGYGDVRDLNWTGQLSSGTRRYRTRRGWTHVRSVVINSCVLNLECNKVPSWNRTYKKKIYIYIYICNVLVGSISRWNFITLKIQYTTINYNTSNTRPTSARPISSRSRTQLPSSV
jgi:hypothetical protein